MSHEMNQSDNTLNAPTEGAERQAKQTGKVVIGNSDCCSCSLIFNQSTRVLILVLQHKVNHQPPTVSPCQSTQWCRSHPSIKLNYCGVTVTVWWKTAAGATKWQEHLPALPWPFLFCLFVLAFYKTFCACLRKSLSWCSAPLWAQCALSALLIVIVDTLNYLTKWSTSALQTFIRGKRSSSSVSSSSWTCW